MMLIPDMCVICVCCVCVFKYTSYTYINTVIYIFINNSTSTLASWQLCPLPQQHTLREFVEVPSNPAERIAHKNKLMNKLETLNIVSTFLQARININSTNFSDVTVL